MLGIICFPLRFALFYSESLHNSIFLYLISCTQLLFELFFLLVDFLRSMSVIIASSQQNVIKMNFILNASNIPYCFPSFHLPMYLTLRYQMICFFALIHYLAIEGKNYNSDTKHITPQDHII